jgi:hypothetical protein
MAEIVVPDFAVRSYVARVEDVNPKKRSVVGKINTSAVDHYRTSILPRGIDLAAFRANPVVLYEHGMDPRRGSLPVARAGWVRPAIGPDGPELIAETIFRDGDDFAQQLFEMYREGLMRGFSVRVVPKPEGNSRPTPDEIKERPELAECWLVFRSTTLAEYSCVAVPGNPECLSTEMARSVLALRDRGLALPDSVVARALAVAPPAAGADPHESSSPEPEPVVLPPLGGRSVAAYRAELLAKARTLIDPAAFKAEVQMHADFRRGVV